MSDDIRKNSLNILITRPPADRWGDYRKVRLEALNIKPVAFSSSSIEEEKYAESIWKERIVILDLGSTSRGLRLFSL
jgi:hypothetical protein